MPVTDEAAKRADPGALLGDEAALVGRAAHEMGGRFNAGATLLTFGSEAASADAHHIAVEFVHPVIVGKRALPAIAIPQAAAAEHLQQLARPVDIAMVISHTGLTPRVHDVLKAAKSMGLLTIALVGADEGVDSGEADHLLACRSDDQLIARELQVTTYHVLWELVHVFLDGITALDENQ